MARRAVAVTVGSTTIGAERFQTVGPVADPVNGSTTAADKTTLDTADTLALTTDKTAVDTDIGVLVADGATPTQAHVNTLNTHWTTMKTDMTALHAAIVAYEADVAGVPATRDVLLSFDVTNTGSLSVLRRAVQRLLHTVEGMGDLTP